MRFSFLIALAFVFCVPTVAHAAILSLVPEKTDIAVGETVRMQVLLHTEEAAINAAQATVTFPADTLEVASIDFVSSIFNFWVEEPTADNTAGTVSFIGGTASGVTGDDLLVATITFKSLGSGTAPLAVDDAVITASDGKGTNVLSAIEGAALTVGVTTYIPEPEFDPATVTTPAVEVVTRRATASTGFPAAPVVSVPLYPNPTTWYRHQEPVTVFWQVPDDVTKVAVAVDDRPNTEPPRAEDALLTGKELGTFDEGENYIHVQFKNNIGWGPVTHYRVAIDTEPPTPFTIEFDSATGDNPTPTLFINSFDALSGVEKVIVSVDDEVTYEFASTTVTLPPQKPGDHTMVVQVLDRARNRAENATTFYIEPIQTPTIAFITSTVSQDEQGFLSGTATPGGFVDIVATSKRGDRIERGVAVTDASGNWRFVFENVLPLGTYEVVATARDQRGAISYPTEPETMKVRPQTILSLGFVDLGWFELLVVFVLLVTSIGGVGAWYYVSQRDMQAAYATIAARDVKKFGDLIVGHMNMLETRTNEHSKGSRSKVAKQLKSDVEYMSQEVRDTVKKMNRYLVDLINKA